MLAATVSGDFSKQARTNGEAFFRQGAVQLLEGDEQSVVGLVRERGRMAMVELTRNGNGVEADCDCSYFRENFTPCKHIWAVLLGAEQKHYLMPKGQGPPHFVQPLEDPAYDENAYGHDLDEDEDDFPDDYAAEWQEKVQRRSKSKPKKTDWKKELAMLSQPATAAENGYATPWPPSRQIVYVIDVPGSKQGLRIDVAYRERKRNGDWSKLKGEGVTREQAAVLPDPADQRILSLLHGPKTSTDRYGYAGAYYGYGGARLFDLSRHQAEGTMPLLAATGRLFLRLGSEKDEITPLQWDDGPPWEFFIRVDLDADGKKFLLQGGLRRGEERLPFGTPLFMPQAGLLVTNGVGAFFHDHGQAELLSRLRNVGPIAVPAKAKDELVAQLAQRAHLVPFELPEELRFEQVTGTPVPRLKIFAPKRNPYYATPRLHGELSFAYEDLIVSSLAAELGVYDKERKRLLLRDPTAERAALARLYELGFRTPAYTDDLELVPRNLPKTVQALLAGGWHVEAEGKLYRRPGNIQIDVKTGIDWFELHGTVDFGDTKAHLPELLAALKRGDGTVQLDDGTFGMLPEDWLKKYGVLAGLGTKEEDHLRFSRCQVGLLDALLASQPEATCDATFAKARDELRRFQGIEPGDPPASFTGDLRPYQRDGLGWFDFLQRFNFGGCLADDMGLGKTVQVLALMEARRLLRGTADAHKTDSAPAEPSIIVVPRSLVFNWKQEAARFTPDLRILDHTGVDRKQETAHFAEHDIVLTTYGTLRRDVLLLKDVLFDYCILDEAQAVKNAATESAKAVRLLQSRHRLALSGTPVENHLGELWSLFEFLNPGMLGSASVFRLGGSAARNPDEETRKLLAQALRPFILRRTKDQVAKDLPDRLEQTLFCELEGEQRRLYDELRDHYRRSLLEKVDKDGLNKAKMQVLEALLRLRQAACHPGLIDKQKIDDSAAKLDLLLPQVEEVIDEGHKVLVFSQFTSLLAIVRKRLDKAGIRYEYLDGRTRDRGARVESFQNDPDCKLFLISLKAGGLGLNLTAAEYVFLLDPWWNPAVEAQAIDRAHRIGQSRRVFAYRLIARNTVEEKVLQLQESKRALADAIINADNSLIRNLGREDLELLLS